MKYACLQGAKMTVGQKVLRFFQTRVVRMVILLASLLVAAGIIRSVFTITKKREIVLERKAVLEAEEAKRANLERRLQEATSAAFIERAAREKLGLVREGETVVIMDKSLSTSSATPTLQDVSSWKQWWKLFF